MMFDLGPLNYKMLKKSCARAYQVTKPELSFGAGLMMTVACCPIGVGFMGDAVYIRMAGSAQVAYSLREHLSSPEMGKKRIKMIRASAFKKVVFQQNGRKSSKWMTSGLLNQTRHQSGEDCHKIYMKMLCSNHLAVEISS